LDLSLNSIANNSQALYIKRKIYKKSISDKINDYKNGYDEFDWQEETHN
jgi:hypothetical protein